MGIKIATFAFKTFMLKIHSEISTEIIFILIGNALSVISNGNFICPENTHGNQRNEYL